MFGRKKKEAKIEAQPLPVEPVEDFLDAEIIADDDVAPAEIDTSSIEGEDINLDAIDDLSGAIGDQRSSIDDIMITPGIENIPADVVLETADIEEEPKTEEPVEEELLPDIEEATLEEAAEEPVEEVAEEPAEEAVEESEEVEEAVEEATEDDAEVEDEESEEESEEEETEEEAPAEEQEEVVYVVDGPEEDDEIVRASKLVKLPHLIDYIVNSDPKPSKKALMKYALMLADLYKKCNNPEDKKIVKGCVIKVANALR